MFIMDVERIALLALRFTAVELDNATESYAKSRLLGAGGFGSVFRGHIGGTDIAVKRLDMVFWGYT